MLSYIAFAVFGFASLASGQDFKDGLVTVPTTNCTWRGGDYGQWSQCLTNEVPIGSCGSGRDPDCQNFDQSQFQYDMILCCGLDGYAYGNCVEKYGDYGFDVSCLQSDTSVENSIVEGVCGSGRDADCNGSTHGIICCNGAFENGERLYSSGTCQWSYADYGFTIQCASTQQAIFGRCGSGRDPDCEGENYHGIQCCTLYSFLGQ